MFSIDTLKNDLKNKMEKAIDVLKHDFTGLRTGRASTNLLDAIKVNAYGSETPLNQVASLSVPDARTISVSVWDKGLLDSVMKAITESDLGLNPQNDSTLIRIPLPALNEERRKELVKTAHGYAENAKTAVRNIRRDGMDTLKKAEKDKEISEDEQKRFEIQIQDLTDASTKSIDDMVSKKEIDIMAV
ncbi:MAG: ribosome recycling factor [Alphaproteobacteria bacterium]|nr:ribosome recycling factor [Alphaproteobacteria bacterium]MBN2780051.1 ribosome recycling factor [Alphaproteobacteria bacterium]